MPSVLMYNPLFPICPFTARYHCTRPIILMFSSVSSSTGCTCRFIARERISNAIGSIAEWIARQGGWSAALEELSATISSTLVVSVLVCSALVGLAIYFRPWQRWAMLSIVTIVSRASWLWYNSYFQVWRSMPSLRQQELLPVYVSAALLWCSTSSVFRLL